MLAYASSPVLNSLLLYMPGMVASKGKGRLISELAAAVSRVETRVPLATRPQVQSQAERGHTNEDVF